MFAAKFHSEIISHLLNAKERLTYWKDEEHKLRLQAVAQYATPGKDVGTERKLLDDGWTIAVTHVLNYTINNNDGQIEYMRSIMPKEMFDDLFRVKYEISVPAYNALTVAQKQALDWLLTIKPGLPQVELLPPTEDKVV